MLDQLIQIISIATAGAATIYILGGLIVNIYLTQYGIVEYQVLQTKFLAVGIMFLVNDVLVNLFSYFVAIFIGILFTVSSSDTSEIILLILTCIPSVIFSTFLFRKSLQKPKLNQKHNEAWTYMYWMGAIANIPCGFFLTHLLLDQSLPVKGQSLLTIAGCGALAQIALIYYYSQQIYGSRASDNKALLIGGGAPAKVIIAGDAAQIGLLKELGVPIRKKGITEPVHLIDETDSQYIIGIEKNDKIQPVKLMKKYVTAILYEADEVEKGNKS